MLNSSDKKRDRQSSEVLSVFCYEDREGLELRRAEMVCSEPIVLTGSTLDPRSLARLCDEIAIDIGYDSGGIFLKTILKVVYNDGGKNRLPSSGHS